MIFTFGHVSAIPNDSDLTFHEFKITLLGINVYLLGLIKQLEKAK